jgi:hypothetical protein
MFQLHIEDARGRRAYPSPKLVALFDAADHATAVAERLQRQEEVEGSTARFHVVDADSLETLHTTTPVTAHARAAA